MYINKYYRNEKNTTFTIINIIRKKNANTKNHKYNTDKWELFDVKYYLIIRSKVGGGFWSCQWSVLIM